MKASQRALVVFIVGIIISIGCTDAGAQQSSIVGKYFSKRHPQHYIELRSDGTFFIPGQERTQQGVPSTVGAYNVKGDQVTLRARGEDPIQAKLRGTTLIYPNGERWTKKTLNVAGPSAPPEFREFYAALIAAVHARNRAEVQKMMSEKFEWATDGDISRDQAWQNIENLVGLENFWTAASHALATRPAICKPAFCPSNDGYWVGIRSPGPFEMIFRRGADGVWRWSALLGG